MPSLPARIARLASLPLARRSSLAACGQAQQQGGGFHGFPPAEVTHAHRRAEDDSRSRSSTSARRSARRRSRCARASAASSRSGCSRKARAVKAGQTLFLIDPKPLRGAGGERRGRAGPRAGADGAGAARGARLKPLAERKAIGQKEADDAASDGRARRAPRSRPPRRSCARRGSTSATRASSRRSPGSSSRAHQVRRQPRRRRNDTLLTTISQIDPMWVQFNVSENEQLRIERAVAERQARRCRRTTRST